MEILQWIRFYESIGELEDYHRPSDPVVKDDEACDKWKATFEQQQRKKMLEYYERTEGRKVTTPEKASRVFGGKK